MSWLHLKTYALDLQSKHSLFWTGLGGSVYQKLLALGVFGVLDWGVWARIVASRWAGCSWRCSEAVQFARTRVFESKIHNSRCLRQLWNKVRTDGANSTLSPWRSTDLKE